MFFLLSTFGVHSKLFLQNCPLSLANVPAMNSCHIFRQFCILVLSSNKNVLVDNYVNHFLIAQLYTGSSLKNV